MDFDSIPNCAKKLRLGNKGVIFLQSTGDLHHHFELVDWQELQAVLAGDVSRHNLNFVAFTVEDCVINDDLGLIIVDEIPRTIINISTIFYDIEQLHNICLEGYKFFSYEDYIAPEEITHNGHTYKLVK